MFPEEVAAVASDMVGYHDRVLRIVRQDGGLGGCQEFARVSQVENRGAFAFFAPKRSRDLLHEAAADLHPEVDEVEEIESRHEKAEPNDPPRHRVGERIGVEFPVCRHVGNDGNQDEERE